MEPAEFEEKEYEGPLYNQLLNGSHRISTPGQVFENAFGIDAAIEALHPGFWTLFEIGQVPRGVVLNDYNWGWIWRRFGRQRNLATFPVNLLVQAKRPDFLKGRNPNLSHLGVTGQYWRFLVRDHQQPILERLSKQLRHRAYVVYASPAFHTYSKLNQHTESKTIIENSTFVTAERMKGHQRWNYDQPGTSGVAHSQPIGFEGPDFYHELDALTSEAKPERASIELKQISSAVMVTAEELPHNPLPLIFRSGR